jgi:hypothetical protein
MIEPITVFCYTAFSHLSYLYPGICRLQGALKNVRYFLIYSPASRKLEFVSHESPVLTGNPREIVRFTALACAVVQRIARHDQWQIAIIIACLETTLRFLLNEKYRKEVVRYANVDWDPEILKHWEILIADSVGPIAVLIE